MSRAHAGHLTRLHQPHSVAGTVSGVGIWWLNPAILFAVVAIGTLLPAVALSDSVYSSYGTPKYLDRNALALALLATGMVACGVGLGMYTGAAPRRITIATRQSLAPWFYLATGLTVLGYMVWTASAVLHGLSPGQIKELLAGGDHEAFVNLKTEVFKTVPGISTCTQFGLLAVMLAGIMLRPDARYLRPLTALVVVMAAVRSVLYSERLALLEIIVVLGLVLLRTRVLNRPRTAAAQLGLLIAPFVGVVLLLALMAGTEYFRSWQYYQGEFDSLLSFTTNRLAGYYSTSHNNGAMAWHMREGWPLPFFTLEWFWKFPLVRATPLSYDNLAGFDPDLTYASLLEQWGSAEFNNPGGLFVPTLDFGIMGGGIFWLAFGFAAGRLYRGFVAGSLAGLLLYPFIALSILELPRYFYVCTVRPFAPIVLIGILLWWCARRQEAVHVS